MVCKLTEQGEGTRIAVEISIRQMDEIVTIVKFNDEINLMWQRIGTVKIVSMRSDKGLDIDDKDSKKYKNIAVHRNLFNNKNRISEIAMKIYIYNYMINCIYEL